MESYGIISQLSGAEIRTKLKVVSNEVSLYVISEAWLAQKTNHFLGKGTTTVHSLQRIVSGLTNLLTTFNLV